MDSIFNCKVALLVGFLVPHTPINIKMHTIALNTAVLWHLGLYNTGTCTYNSVLGSCFTVDTHTNTQIHTEYMHKCIEYSQS